MPQRITKAAISLTRPSRSPSQSQESRTANNTLLSRSGANCRLTRIRQLVETGD